MAKYGLSKLEKSYLSFILLLFLVFLVLFYYQRNYEFIWYIVSFVFVWGILLFICTRDLEKKSFIFFLIALLALIHQLGGYISFNGVRLYDSILFLLYQGNDVEFVILKFDQVVHFVGGCILAYILFKCLENKIKVDYRNFYSKAFFSVIVILSALGVSVIHEMLEFVSQLEWSSGVGFYYNTLLDFYFNFVGILIVTIFMIYKIKWTKK